MELQSNLAVDMLVFLAYPFLKMMDYLPIHLPAMLGYTPLFIEFELLIITIILKKGLLINAGGGIVIMLWSFSIILILYIVLRYFGLHRVSPSDEEIGLDMALHNQKAYRHCDTKREKSTG